MQKGKQLSEEALQIAQKRKEVKGKGESKRYKHLNAEFQRIARRDDKVFLSNQCQKKKKKRERERNIRIGKNRDLFKKIRYTKKMFHAQLGTVKYGNGMDLTEA